MEIFEAAADCRRPFAPVAHSGDARVRRVGHACPVDSGQSSDRRCRRRLTRVHSISTGWRTVGHLPDETVGPASDGPCV